MKLMHLWLIVIAAIVVLSACNQNGSHQQSSSEHSTQYHRIISLMPSNTETLYKLGLGKDVIGVSTVDDYPKEVKDKKQFDAMNLNKEALLKAKPDLILAHESQKASSEETLKALRKSGVKVVYVKDAHSIDETYQTFRQIGKVTGKEDKADQLVERTKRDVKKVIDSVPKHHATQNVFMEVSSEPEIYTAGKQTFYDDMLHQLKAQNSFGNLKGWQKVSKEDIIRSNPDIMIGTSGKSAQAYQKIVKQRGGMDQTNAVQHQRITSVDGDQISRPGPRIAEGLQQLRDAIYKDSQS